MDLISQPAEQGTTGGAKVAGGLVSTPGALLNLGCAMMKSGEGAKAVALVKALTGQDPDDPRLQSAARKILSCEVPQWHEPMLRDTARNDAFEGAIRRAVRPETKVLDIGTGSGLLAMMSARAGAEKVVACEGNPALAATAADIVAANGYADRIKVVAKLSTELDRDADLDGGVDLVVSEIMSDDLLSEGVLPSFDHARRELVRSGARFIPSRITMRVALAFYDQPELEKLGEVSGFDLSLFDRHVMGDRRPKVGDKRLQLRSVSADLMSFDLQSGAPYKGGEASVRLTATGRANGFSQWIRFVLDDEQDYENQPSPGSTSAWGTYFHPFPGARVIEAGEQAVVHAAHDGVRVHLW